MSDPSSTLAAEYAAVQDYLFSLKAGGVKFGIDRMQAFTAAFGHPERAVPCIHLAGTNGKGSTSALLESILRGGGWRTGLYTSPHLVRLGERVQVDRVPLREAEIIAYTAELRPVAERVAAEAPDDQPSFFEFMTGMAFLQFARRGCDIALIEVGLGGRLDATNVVQPEVAVITSIGYDHCELLGNTLTQIATEKGGIIKPGVPVVLGRMPAEAEQVLRRIADERGSPLDSVREAFGDDVAAYPETNLEGDYQRLNAATATLVARRLPPRWRLDEATIAHGLRHAHWPGRWERLRLADGRLLVLDASHNPEGVAVLDVNLTRLAAETGRAPVVIAGALGATRAGPLLEVLGRHARALHLAVPQQARASSWAELEELVPSGFRGAVHRATVTDLFPQRGVCRAGGPEDVLVVTGSIYLLGEVLARLQPERGAGEGRLQDF